MGPTVGRRAGQVVTRQVKPLLSLDKDEARVRVFALYRAWYRQLPVMFKDWDMDVTERMLKDRLKEEFMKHAHIKDIKVIDMKVIQGQQELQECANRWQSRVSSCPSGSRSSTLMSDQKISCQNSCTDTS